MWAIWVSEPMGGWRPWRAAMTPAMKVEATAPMPGVRTPSLPVAGAMLRAFIQTTIKQTHVGMLLREADLKYSAPGASAVRPSSRHLHPTARIPGGDRRTRHLGRGCGFARCESVGAVARLGRARATRRRGAVRPRRAAPRAARRLAAGA